MADTNTSEPDPQPPGDGVRQARHGIGLLAGWCTTTDTNIRALRFVPPDRPDLWVAVDVVLNDRVDITPGRPRIMGATRFQAGYSHLDQPDPTRLAVEWRGRDRWCVVRHPGRVPCQVWDNNTRGWVFEPPPPARTDEFITHTRYGFEAALRLAQRINTKTP